MPLHHRHKAGKLCRTPVQIRRRQRPGKPGDIKAPERDTRHGRRQSCLKDTVQLPVLRLLVASPVYGCSVGSRKSRSGKKYIFFFQELGISVCISLCISIFSLRTCHAAGKQQIAFIDKFPAVRFKSVYSHIQQILPFSKPVLFRLRIGKIRYHGTGKPVPFRNPVGASVFLSHTKRFPDRIFPVKLQLSADTFVHSLLFIDRNLPENQPDILFMQFSDHGFGIRPVRAFGKIKLFTGMRPSIRLRLIIRAVPDVKCGLIAPRLQHHHAGREPIFLKLPQLLFHRLPAVPVVRRNPDSKAVFWRKQRRPENLHICGDYLFYRTRKYMYRRFGRYFTFDCIPETEFCFFRRFHINSQSCIRYEKRGCQIRVFTLPAEFFHHLVYRSFSFLIQPVIFFSHTISAFIRNVNVQDIRLTGIFPAKHGLPALFRRRMIHTGG